MSWRYSLAMRIALTSRSVSKNEWGSRLANTVCAPEGIMQPNPKATKEGGLRAKLHALRNVPSLLKLVWSAGRCLCVCSILSRGAAAVVPVGVLWVSKRILDEVVLLTRHERASPERIWHLLIIEFALVVAGDIISRVTNLCDAILGDRFTQSVNIKLLEHANRLDLETFESPAFHDRLERARSQASSKLGVFSNVAQCFQQSATLASLLMGMVFFAPALVLLQAAAVVP